jgi:hypothetical protein
VGYCRLSLRDKKAGANLDGECCRCPILPGGFEVTAGRCKSILGKASASFWITGK